MRNVLTTMKPELSLSRDLGLRGAPSQSPRTYEATANPYEALSGALEAVLELSGARRVVEACNRLASVLDSLATPPPEDLPAGTRPDLHRLMAVLTFPTWEEVVRWATLLHLDLRDLVEAEI